MAKAGLRIGVIFGGRSVEHDVSIITGLQAVEALSERHRPLPIYITRDGEWLAGEGLRELAGYREQNGPRGEPVAFDLRSGGLLPAAQPGARLLRAWRAPEPIELDAIVLATHGTHGEDGCLQGALALAGAAYVGPPVGAAAAAMDKAMTKALLAAAGLPALPHLALRREAWERDPAGEEARIAGRFEMPVFVKPCSLGSSVGVSRCAQPAQLRGALELCFELDRVSLIEPAVEGGVEVNCAVIGRPGAESRASACEQPVAAESFLSFDDKYMTGAKGAQAGGAKGGDWDAAGAAAPAPGAASAAGGAKGAGMQSAKRIVPAPIGDEQTALVQELARRAFEAFGCAGVARVDFLIDAAGKVYVNELNTIPGSFSFYLWEPAGLPFVDLMDELIDLALAERDENARSTTVFQTSLLAERAGAGKA